MIQLRLTASSNVVVIAISSLLSAEYNGTHWTAGGSGTVNMDAMP